jgi:hypothetical protein
VLPSLCTSRGGARHRRFDSTRLFDAFMFESTQSFVTVRRLSFNIPFRKEEIAKRGDFRLRRVNEAISHPLEILLFCWVAESEISVRFDF